MKRSALVQFLIVAMLVLCAGAGWLYAKGMHPAHPIATLVPGTPQSRRLFVFVKGGSADGEKYQPLLRRLLAEPELAGSDVLLFDHQIGRLTIGRGYEFATRLRSEIDAQWIRHGGYEDILLAGHSTGSLLLRAAYLQSAGRDPRQPRTVQWSEHVSRIVLLAGIGRGVDAEERGRWSLVLRAGRFIPFIRSSVMYDVLRGADFVSDVRIAWIRHMFELTSAATRDSTAPRPPIVVQVLGTEDDVVRRDDNIDLEQFPNAYHIDIPGAGHQTLHRLELTPAPELSYRLVREAFVGQSFPHASTQRRKEADPIRRVVFLLHGMRSSRDDWVREIAPMLRERMPDAEVVESSYGWISLLSFALPSVRRREISWLQDQYSEYLARHPAATFDVVAHSNGAYIVGQALEHVPSMRFSRVALLGSVLPSDYPWTQRREWGQADLVRTDRTADDLVVAVFCNALRGVGMTDVGTSGWSGFEDTGGVERDIAWFRGGHSAALAPSNLKNVADFLTTGRTADDGRQLGRGPSRGVLLLSQLAPWLARFGLAAIITLLGRFLWRPTRRRQRLALLATVALLMVVILDVA